MNGTQYQVALSFAGEQRAYVERVAQDLQARGIALFYDGFEKVALWGRSGTETFQGVFEQRSAYVVMFISKEYVEKSWPRHERRSALTWIIREDGDSGGDTGASVWYKRCAHKRLATTEAPA